MGSPWSSLSLSNGRRQSKQARQAARQTELKRLRMAQAIQRQLEEIEVKQKELEDQGVRLEKALRGEEISAFFVSLVRRVHLVSIRFSIRFFSFARLSCRS